MPILESHHFSLNVTNCHLHYPGVGVIFTDLLVCTSDQLARNFYFLFFFPPTWKKHPCRHLSSVEYSAGSLRIIYSKNQNAFAFVLEIFVLKLYTGGATRWKVWS